MKLGYPGRHNPGKPLVLYPSEREFLQEYAPYWYNVLSTGKITRQQFRKYVGYGRCPVAEVRKIGTAYCDPRDPGWCRHCFSYAARFLWGIAPPGVAIDGTVELTDSAAWHARMRRFIMHVKRCHPTPGVKARITRGMVVAP